MIDENDVSGNIWYQFSDGEYTSLSAIYTYDASTRTAEYTFSSDLNAFGGITYFEIGLVKTANSSFTSESAEFWIDSDGQTSGIEIFLDKGNFISSSAASTTY